MDKKEKPSTAYCLTCEREMNVVEWHRIEEGEHKGKFLATFPCGHSTRYVYAGED